MFRRLLILVIVVVAAWLGYKLFIQSKQDQSNTNFLNGSSQSVEKEAIVGQNGDASNALSKLANLRLPTVASQGNVIEPKVDANAWLLYDANSGQVISQSNPDLRVEPASLTKLMTASLVFSALDEKRLTLDQIVTVSSEARAAEGSRTFIEVNKPVKIGDLIQGMIVQSGNDATIQLAQAVSGSIDVFVGEMNKRAQAFGMKNTHFADPAGLPSTETYTTVHDLALLSRHIIQDFPEYYHYFSQLEFTFNKIRQQNRNGLLRRNMGVDGLKTGHTSKAGYNLVATAKRDNRRIVSIVTGTKGFSMREQASASLLEWGFQNFSDKVVAGAGKPILEPRVWEGTNRTLKVGSMHELTVTVPRMKEEAVQTMTQVNSKLVAPLNKGQLVGSVQFIVDGKVIKQEPLVVLEDAERASFFPRMWDKVLQLF